MINASIRRNVRRAASTLILFVTIALVWGSWRAANAGKPPGTFACECSVSGQTVATWKGAQLSRVDFQWYSSNDGGNTFSLIGSRSFSVKKKPSGSISAPSPSGTYQADAYFYDPSGAVVGSAYQNCSP